MVTINFEIESETYQTEVEDAVCEMIENSLEEKLELKMTRCQLIVVKENTPSLQRQAVTSSDESETFSRLEIHFEQLVNADSSVLDELLSDTETDLKNDVIEALWTDIFHKPLNHVKNVGNIDEFKSQVRFTAETDKSCFLKAFANLFASLAPTPEMLPNC